LIVDDSAVFRGVLKRALEGIEGVEVAGTSPNGRLALQRIQAEPPPDLVTLDLEMPELDGIGFLEGMRVLQSKPGVIVLSAAGEAGRRRTIRALELGAFDFVPKPESGDLERSTAELREKLAPVIAAAAHRIQVRSILSGAQVRAGGAGEGHGSDGVAGQPGHNAPPRPAAGTSSLPVGAARPPSVDGMAEVAGRMHRLTRRTKPALALIGVSTGGPDALLRVIPKLPAGLSVPVLVVQHMPPLFTQSLAETLDARSALRVREARNGDLVAAGSVYIAPGGRHMKVMNAPGGGMVLRITDDPPENNCRPAVDYLFRSAAEAVPGRSVAVILTGMGRDGSQGLRRLKADGCVTIAQDEASCTVFGMPREAIQAGVIDIVAPLDSIAAEMVKAVEQA
jgi:two-component system chemotaxis response regulator CheB